MGVLKLVTALEQGNKCLMAIFYFDFGKINGGGGDKNHLDSLLCKVMHRSLRKNPAETRG